MSGNPFFLHSCFVHFSESKFWKSSFLRELCYCCIRLFVSDSRCFSLLFDYCILHIQVTMVNPNPILDPSSPFYVHSNENPGALLVSSPRVGDNHHSSWSIALTMALKSKNELPFGDGTLPSRRKKLDLRARKFIFSGFKSGTKGCVLFDLKLIRI